MTKTKLPQQNAHQTWFQLVSSTSLLGFAKLFLVISFMFVSASICSASATNIYIAQASAGGATGADCADALPALWFNSSANWGAAAGKIGPGTTVHLCGTFTASAGSSNYLTFQGAGTSGNPITLHFETGAVITAPYWSGAALSGGGNSFIVVDGGTNGTIQATANGTSLANQQDEGEGIDLSGSSNSEIKNVTIQNIYVHTCTLPLTNCTDVGGQNTYDIRWVGGSHVSIDNNTIHDAKFCILYAYQNNTAISIFNNTISACDHGGVVGDAGSGDVLSGSNCANSVYGNTIHDLANWDDNADANHHDGWHFWANNAPSSYYQGVCFYNNYEYGNMGQHLNSEVGVESEEMSMAVFNNVLTMSDGACAVGIIGAFTGSGQGGSGLVIANNTVEGDTSGSNLCQIGIGVQTTTGVTMENNIVLNVDTYVYAPTSGTFTTADHNLYGTPAEGFFGPSGCNGGASFSAWQSPCGFDVHGKSAVSGVNTTTFALNGGSNAIGLGANLTSLGITALNSDKAGVARPSSVSLWDAGAYQSGVLPNPPTALSATVQ